MTLEHDKQEKINNALKELLLELGKTPIHQPLQILKTTMDLLFSQYGFHNSFIMSFMKAVDAQGIEKDDLLPILKQWAVAPNEALKVLAEIKVEEAIKFIIKFLGESKKPYLREPAGKLLMELSSSGKLNERAIELLLGVIIERRYFHGIAEALSKVENNKAIEKALAKMETEETIPLIIKFLGEVRKPYLREPAEKLLMNLSSSGELNDKEIELLLGVINDFPKIIAEALSKVGNKRAIEALMYAYKHGPNKRVRDASGRALDRLGKRPKSLLEKLFRQ